MLSPITATNATANAATNAAASGGPRGGEHVTTLTVTTGWTLELARAGDGTPDALAGLVLPATVPGCVHTDLLAAGVVPDPLLDRNEDLLQWIGRCDWRYRCRLTAPPELLAHDRVELCCDGLDTVASVELNGALVGTAENMHRPHRFDVMRALSIGENELVVTFASALDYAWRQLERLGDRPRAYPLPYNFIRKMACNFGWDWGPTLVTAGIWRPLRLEGWSAARVRELRTRFRPAGLPAAGTLADPSGGQPGRDETTPDATTPATTAPATTAPAAVELLLELERSGPPRPLSVTAHLSGPVFPPGAERTVDDLTARATVEAGRTSAELRLDVPAAELWWPRGYGAQPLYRLTVDLADEAGELLERHELRAGFRRVDLDARPDAAGAAFTLVVNGRPVFAKGADWIPDDPFPSRVDDERLRSRLEQAAAANMNALRVWGGGLYESDAFYDACDELGLLVWQDFAFACAAYPEEAPFAAEVEAEARANVLRLAHHPSLALWNGNNENLWGYVDWGWEAELHGRSWGRGFYLETLPRVVAELDPDRPYWAGSPWSGREDLHPNADGAGCKHVWDAWNEKDYTVYREKRPRFVAEFGHQAPAAHATLQRALSDRPLAPDSPGLLHHQKAAGGNAKLEARLAEHFPLPRDFDAWHFATQLNQARALDLGIRHFRSLAPHCMGTLVWQLNDCWPATSWAAIDVDGRRKPLWHALERAFAARLVTLEPRPDGLRLVLHNDDDRPWPAEVRLRRLRLDGTELAARTYRLEAPPRAVAEHALDAELTTPGSPRDELLLADAGPLRHVHAFVRDKELRYPEARWTVRLESDGDEHRVTVLAHTLARDVTLLPDRLHPDAVVDDALVTLLPGESHRFTLHCPGTVDLEALSRPPVLTSANHVVRAPRRP